MTVMWAAMVLLALELMERGSRIIPVLSIVALTVFTVAWVLESAFHTGVTVWAVKQLEAGRPVPKLFEQLKSWLNVYVQWMVNPLAFLAFLAFIGLSIGTLTAGVLPGWAAWPVIVWSGVWLFVPFPLALFPIPVFMGAVMLIRG